MFNRIAFENSRPDGIGVLEVVGRNQDDVVPAREFVPLKKTFLDGQVAGPLATMRLLHTYGYTREECDQVLEAVYRFPLPGDAAVTGVKVRFGATEITAELKERAEAERDYDQAKEDGRQAALVTREAPNVFTLQVAGIQPGEDITVETTYVQLARAEGAGWSLRIPLTTAPRYVRSDELTSAHAQGQPLRLLRDPGHRFSMEVSVRGAASVNSSTHKIDVRQADNQLAVRLAEGEVIPDRDCVLAWRPVEEADRPTLAVISHDDPLCEHVYFLALVAPPATHDRGNGVPREMTLLVDHSGSMQGPKWQAADWAVERFISDLGDRDALALGVFHSTTTWFAPQLRAADAAGRQDATAFLKSRLDTGGTELGVALEQALRIDPAAGERARHVLVLTDAEVSDAGRILRLATEESAKEQRRRISVLCIDAAPNSLLAIEMAERGGGVARFLTSEPDQEDITTALDEILADWSEPVLSGLKLEVNAPGVEGAGRAVVPASEPSWSAIDLGDLPAGRPLWVAGRVKRPARGPLVLRLTTARQKPFARAELEPSQVGEAHPAIKALFGARRVLGLENLVHSDYETSELNENLRSLGYDPLVVRSTSGRSPAVYAENTRDDARALLKPLLVSESLEYGLASMETAFVAVRTEAGQRVQQSVAVANALPAGWSDKFLAGGSTMFAQLALSAPATFTSGASQLRRSARHMHIGGTMAPFGYDSAASIRACTSSPAAPASAPPTRGRSAGLASLFSGTPSFSGGEAVLFDSSRSRDKGKVPDVATINQLEIRFSDGAPDGFTLDPDLSVLVFVDDLASPRARVKLADLVRQNGQRPLNLAKEAGQVVRIVLVDPNGAWSQGAPKIEVLLGW